MTACLTIGEALRIAEAVVGGTPEVRDMGLIQSSLARPQSSAFGTDAYLTLDEKAAALLQSLVSNHGLVNGNKRLGLACTSVFLTINGAPLDLDDENEAYDVVVAVATGELVEIADIAHALRQGASWTSTST
jgi:death-on-curing protein